MISVGIVGAGPAGMMAALEAARQGARVLLFDTNPLVGRKLLVTGNGRCNLSNEGAAAGRYACASPEVLDQIFSSFGSTHLVAALRDLGVLIYTTHDGWVYPVSNSAATVQEAFAAALELAGIELHLQTKISDIQPQQGGFKLCAGGSEHHYPVNRLVVASGGRAYPALGSKGELFPVLKRLGHRVERIRPALAPIRADVRAFHKLQGVRLDVGLTLYQGEEPVAETVGNLMFTQFGFSGPAAMDLSYRVEERANPPQTLGLDLLIHHRPELERLLLAKRNTALPLRVLLGAVLPAKMPPVLLELAGLPADVRMNQVADDDLERLLTVLTDSRVTVKGTRGFQFGQLSTGGVPLTEIRPASMESRRVPGLYLAGEVLDVVGPCGGFNLQFAFSSGALAGRAAGRAQ